MSELEKKIQETTFELKDGQISKDGADKYLATLCREYVKKFNEWKYQNKLVSNIRWDNISYYTYKGKQISEQDLITEFENQVSEKQMTTKNGTKYIDDEYELIATLPEPKESEDDLLWISLFDYYNEFSNEVTEKQRVNFMKLHYKLIKI